MVRRAYRLSRQKILFRGAFCNYEVPKIFRQKQYCSTHICEDVAQQIHIGILCARGTTDRVQAELFSRLLCRACPQAMESEDDFYGEQRGEDVDRLERERDIVKLERIHVATGFRDSAESSRDAHLQCGFDSGFLDGAAAVAPAAFWCVILSCKYTTWLQ